MAHKFRWAFANLLLPDLSVFQTEILVWTISETDPDVVRYILGCIPLLPPDKRQAIINISCFGLCMMKGWRVGAKRSLSAK